jgi:hypothetical protein
VSATVDDMITIDMSGTIGAFVSAYVNDILHFTLDGAMVGSISASMNDTISFVTNNPILMANAVMSVDDELSLSLVGSMKGNGFMVATLEQSDAALTAKDVWEYYQRTLTSGESGGSGFTLEQIAAAIWNSDDAVTKGDIYAAAFAR